MMRKMEVIENRMMHTERREVGDGNGEASAVAAVAQFISQTSISMRVFFFFIHLL